MKESKQSLRARALLRMENISTAEFITWNRTIQERVLNLRAYLQSQSIALYSSMGKEVTTDQIRDHALGHGKSVFYPRLESGEMHLVRTDSPENMKPGRYGILEPVGEERITERNRESLVVLVPGVAFDLVGNRLGRGLGWYDRTLKRLREGVSFVALAYEFQILQEVPEEEWDQKMHQVVTEERVIECAGDVAQP